MLEILTALMIASFIGLGVFILAILIEIVYQHVVNR